MTHLQTVDPVLLASVTENLKELVNSLKDQQAFASKWLPGIVGITSTLVALAIGLLSYKGGKEQIKTTRLIAEAQIASTKDIAKTQIETTKETTIAEIKANLVAASRKEWIENLRSKIAVFFASINEIHTLQSENKNSAEKHQGMWELSAYIEMMLNPNEPTHNEFVLKQKIFANFCLQGDKDYQKWAVLKNEYLTLAKNILKVEWEKVKKFN